MTDAAIKPGDPIDVIYGDRRFVAWRYERGSNGQPAKIPYTPGLGAKARSNDPATWRSHAEAQATLEKGAVDGISYALMQRDNLAALDLDHCMDANGAWSAWALDLVDEAQSYTEITPSNEGLRILGVVTGPLPDMHFHLPRGGNNGEKVECFHHTAQFITLSRKPFLSEMTLADITPIVARLAQERAAKTTGTTGKGAGEPIPLTPLPQDIRELIVHGSAAGTRSENLMKVTGWLRRAGYVRAAIEATLRAYPAGIAERCFEQGKDDLHRQLQLCIDKIDDDEATKRKQRQQSQNASGWREHSMPASTLQQQQFPPMKTVIPGLLTEGVTLLAGKPKKGKTWMALDIAVAVAAPRICLGDFVPVHGDVLYVALEDNPRRLQRRLKHILVHDDEAWPDRLTFAFNWRRLNEGGVDDLAEWLDEHAAEARLIVIDTLAAVRSLSKDYGYNEDYSALAGLQRFAGERGIAVLVVHHLRKAGADDFGDEISGTLGLTAAVDGFLVLRGNGDDVELCLRSRDIEERKYGATFNQGTCRWTLDRSSEHDRSKDRILNVLREAEEPLSPAEIVRLTGLNRGLVDKQLQRLRQNGEVRRENSRYSLGGMA